MIKNGAALLKHDRESIEVALHLVQGNGHDLTRPQRCAAWTLHLLTMNKNMFQTAREKVTTSYNLEKIYNQLVQHRFSITFQNKKKKHKNNGNISNLPNNLRSHRGILYESPESIKRKIHKQRS
jgi:hypothetical protein